MTTEFGARREFTPNGQFGKLSRLGGKQDGLFAPIYVELTQAFEITGKQHSQIALIHRQMRFVLHREYGGGITVGLTYFP